MKRLYLVVLLLFISTSTQSSTKSVVERLKNIENHIRPRHLVIGLDLPVQSLQERMQQLNAPGLSVAVAIDGKIVWAEGFGLADIEEKRPVTTDTLFQAASISKPIAAIRALQLAETGKIDLDVDVNKYLESWKVHYNVYSNGKKVTTRHILNHTGRFNVWSFIGYKRNTPLPNTLDILQGRANTPAILLSGEPGKHWLYSGGGYTVLEQMLIDVDQIPFPELMQKFVFFPLGMTNSTFENPLPEEHHARAATGYNADITPIKGKWLNHPQLAAAGLWSTPTDLIQYAIQTQNLLHGNQIAGESYLSQESVREMLKPGKNNHGLGPVVDEFTFSHNGSSQGFRSILVGWLEHDFAVVAMTNVYDSTLIREFVTSVATEFELPGFNQEVINAIYMSTEDKKKFTGKYVVPELGDLVIFASEKGLIGEPDYYHKTYPLVPINETTFINIDTGTEFNFLVENGIVTGFSTIFGRVNKVN